MRMRVVCVRLVILAVAVALFAAIFGCAGTQYQQNPQANQSVNAPPAGVANASAPAAAGAGVGEIAGPAFNEWAAPDGTITLQAPEGWAASERQVDNCTVSWSVKSPDGSSDAFMNNQIMVFKSENARTMYKSYGMAGTDAVPVNGYLGSEQAMQDVIAKLSGASNVKVLSTDATLSSQFSQAVCPAGLAACDAKVFEAAFDYMGTPMRGYYLVQTYDFGDGATWWINVWGYEAPGAGWAASAGTLERIFTSVKATDEWAKSCGASQDNSVQIIQDVTASRQAAEDNAAAEWDKYIAGG